LVVVVDVVSVLVAVVVVTSRVPVNRAIRGVDAGDGRSRQAAARPTAAPPFSVPVVSVDAISVDVTADAVPPDPPIDLPLGVPRSRIFVAPLFEQPRALRR